jgi:FkbM family methyltransferase
MWLDLADPGISRQLLSRGIREADHTAAIKSAIKPGMIGIDIGANIGYFALLEARGIGATGRLYSLEPSSRNYSLLMRNISSNGWEDRVSVERFAVGDKVGKSALYLSPMSNSHSVLAQHKDTALATEIVDMITIDAFLRTHQVRPDDISFVRMDVEGWEGAVIRGMRSLIEASHALDLFIELHPEAANKLGESAEVLLRDLEEHAFLIVHAVEEVSKGEAIYINQVQDNLVPTQLDSKLPIAGGGIQCWFRRR